MLFFHALQSALVRISTGLMFVGLAVAFASGKASARPDFLIRPENAASDIRERSVAVMRETRDGYLWLGTAFGLVRFDGVTFTNFATQGTPGAVPDSIAANSLWEDQAGVLWAGTEGQGGAPE